MTPHTGLKMALFMEAERGKHSDEGSWWRRQCLIKYRPLSWRQLVGIWQKGVPFWEAKAKASPVGAGSKGNLNKTGQSLKSAHRWSSGRGVRAAGGGRKDHFRQFKEALKVWVHLEREHGHTIDGHDMIEEFLFVVQKAIAHGDDLQTKQQLAPAGAALLLEYKARVVSLRHPQYRKTYIKELMKFCEVRFLKPQRMLKLSYAEEAIRCRLTWMQFDRRMWDLAFGGVEVLQRHVVDPEGVMHRMEDCVICFSDQIPWWGMICRKKQMYLEDEVKGTRTTQKRGWDNEEATKFRITVELRQVILSYFKTGDNPADPVGILGDTLVIVAGSATFLKTASGLRQRSTL